MNINLEKLETQNYAENNAQLKIDVLSLIIQRKKTEATELIVNNIKHNEHIYTTRDDEKSEMWIYEDGIYVPHARTRIKEYCRNILGEAYTGHLATQVIQKIEADTYIEHDTFFTNTIVDEVPVLNGVLNIFKKTLTPFTPDKIFFNKIPIEYDPEKECPAIEQHFSTVLRSQEDVPVIHELFGYLLLKDYRIEKAFMLIGNGRNGKGKTIDLMKRFIGAENCANISLQELETNSFATGNLFNKMANLSGDLDSKALRQTGMFKNVTGRDLISADRKFLPRVHFVNFAKMIFAANELPRTTDVSFAFFNRWVLLDFPYTFVSQEELEIQEDKTLYRLKDVNIIEKLSSPEELSGLLNKALDALARLVVSGDFSYSKNTEEVRNMWLRKSDSFAAFLLDCVEEEYDAKVLKNDLRRGYGEYCRQHKLKMKTDKELKETLFTTYSVSEEREGSGDRRLYYSGVQFKPHVRGVMDVMGFSTYSYLVR